MLNVISGLLSGGATPVTATSYESIATVTVGSGGQSSISFSSIPSTYKHLQIRGILRDNKAASSDNASQLTFNSDTASNYSYHYLAGSGSAASSGASTPIAFIYNYQPAAGAGASIFGATVIDILDYADTNKYKTIRNLEGHDLNGSGSLNFQSGSWRSTSAITSITLTAASSASFVQYSSLALYGIKG